MQLCSEVAVGTSQVAGLIPSHTPPRTEQQRRREMHRELSTLLLFQPVWHLAQISPEVLLLLETSRENRINSGPLAKESCKSCEKVFLSTRSLGAESGTSHVGNGCSKYRFSSHSFEQLQGATSQLMHKMLIAGQGPGKSILEFSRER